jgi:hypothetical protein
MVRRVDYQIVDTDSAKAASQADWLQINTLPGALCGMSSDPFGSVLKGESWQEFHS